MKQRELEIQDFIYLDIERVRSFLAQMSGGLVSETNTETSRTIGGEAQLEGGIPFFGKAAANTDYHFMRSGSETKSLHDHIFEEFYSHLQTNNLLTDIRGLNINEWSENKFFDGQFVLTRGLLKFIDYKNMVAVTQSLPNLVDNLVKITSASQANQTSVGKQSKDIKAQLKGLPFKDIAAFIEQMYSDGIRIKLFPFINSPSIVFICSASREFFRYTPNSITNIYGPVVDANWQCLLQINKGNSFASGELLTKSGNQLEDALEEVFDMVNNMSNVTLGVKFPAISATPIAVLRGIQKSHKA